MACAQLPAANTAELVPGPTPVQEINRQSRAHGSRPLSIEIISAFLVHVLAVEADVEQGIPGHFPCASLECPQRAATRTSPTAPPILLIVRPSHDMDRRGYDPYSLHHAHVVAGKRKTSWASSLADSIAVNPQALTPNARQHGEGTHLSLWRQCWLATPGFVPESA
jgi:hypothetical protein